MTARAAIANALNVTGLVHVEEHYTQLARPGDGFVKWASRGREANGFGWIDTWQVWIQLPQDVQDAEQWLTWHLDTLIAAADTELVVTTVTPAELVLADRTTNGLIFEGTRHAA